MASIKYKAYPFLMEHPDHFDLFLEIENSGWDRSNEEMLKNLGKALYDMILLNTVEQESAITWN